MFVLPKLNLVMPVQVPETPSRKIASTLYAAGRLESIPEDFDEGEVRLTTKVKKHAAFWNLPFALLGQNTTAFPLEVYQ